MATIYHLKDVKRYQQEGGRVRRNLENCAYVEVSHMDLAFLAYMHQALIWQVCITTS